jgi:glycerate kinase
MRIVVAPDKFKGSLPATGVAAAIAAGLRAALPGAEVVTIPVADGGDGTVDAAVAAGFERVPVTAAGPGGSAAVTIAADVDNPLTGPDGAAEVYGPQKGAAPAEVAALADALRRWAAVVAAATGSDWSRAPGSGAAGGVGFAAQAVLGARRRPGIDLVLDLVGFGAALGGAALVITGEGSLDGQSLAGKAPMGVARAAARHGLPVLAVAGRTALTAAQLREAGITAVCPLSDLEPDPARCMARADPLLRRAGRAIARKWVHQQSWSMPREVRS